MIKSISYNQDEIINNIIELHIPSKEIELDPTYSKGVFYKNIKPPSLKFDLVPQTSDTVEASAENLPLEAHSVASIMFDPPFIVGFTRGVATGTIGSRFGGFRYVKDLWEWYEKCFVEFSRVLKKDGVLIFKCQDTVSSGKNHFSHNEIYNMAMKNGFIAKDLFILLAKSRLVGHNHQNQKHARKFHSYFWVFVKK